MNEKNNRSKFLSTSAAAKYFGVSPNTIRVWDSKGYIKTVRVNGSLTGHRRYDIRSFSGTTITDDNTHTIQKTTTYNTNNNSQVKQPQKRGIIYARVSSRHQKDDLERQIKQLHNAYPDYEIVKDIGSGINFKRFGFLKLIERAINRNFDELVVAHKDRFCRFAFDFFKWFFNQYGISLVVLNDTHQQSTEQELAEDLLSIIHVFSCRQNGRRKYKQASNESFNETENEFINEEFSDVEITTTNNEQKDETNTTTSNNNETIKIVNKKTTNKKSIKRHNKEEL
jgi:putative resolvase